MDVFLVEDSVAMRERLTEALEEVSRVRVVGWAEGADEATAAIKRLKPRLVVLDLQLAQGSGLYVLAAIKRLADAPLVAVLTNYPDEAYRTRCVELGADYFFDKAAGLDGLLEAVRGSAGNSRPQSACA
jgi:DNA-binding NarL/FixJ family response regulator